MNRLMTGALLALTLLAAGCGVKRLGRTLVPPGQVDALDRKSPYLKAHLRDGRVLVLSNWKADSLSVAGQGRLLDVNRAVEAIGDLSVRVDSVALFETNVVQPSGTVGGMALLTGASLGVTAYCMENPKACFGSCPTFYVGGRLEAEGFSSSVLPSLEATDVDALWRAPAHGPDLEIRMKNEALETHVVRHVDVLAAPRARGERVFATVDDAFVRGRLLAPAVRATGPEGDCHAALVAFDGYERTSLADSSDLAARESIELTFASAGEGPLGVVLARRQSLLSTYLFYQALAFMGGSAGDMLAFLERGGAWTGGMERALGGIEVSVLDEQGRWMRAGEDSESGPLAVDVRLVELPAVPAGPVCVRLRMARGMWRLDWVALARLSGRVKPVRIAPSSIARIGPGAAPAAGTITTFPGDEVAFRYRLPAGESELFLETRGYYLEWMREEWLADEDPARAALMLARPAESLRALAPAFKAQEAGMERAFWGSRYARP